MRDLQIRPYRPSDFDRLCQIHDPARRVELALAGLEPAFLPFPVAAEREDFFQYPHIDVAEAEGEVVAFCAYTAEELAWLYVDPAQARRGIGRALAAHALAVEPGIFCIEVLWGNTPARALYESLGFAAVRELGGVMPGNESFRVRVWAMERRK